MSKERSAISLQVISRQQVTDANACQTQGTNNTNDPQKKYRLGTVSKNIFLTIIITLHNVFCQMPTFKCIVVLLGRHNHKIPHRNVANGIKQGHQEPWPPKQSHFRWEMNG